MVGSSYLILKGIYLLSIRYAIPSIPPMLLLYSGGSYLFIFLCVLGWKRVREVGIEPTETVCLLTGVLIAFHRGSVQSRAVTVLLARDAHPFALTLQSYRGRGLSGSRLRLAHFSRCASGRGLDFCYRGCITHLSVGGVSSYLFIVVCYSIVAGQVPSLLGQVHPGASS